MRTDTTLVVIGSVAVVALYLSALHRKRALARPARGSSSLVAGYARALGSFPPSARGRRRADSSVTSPAPSPRYGGLRVNSSPPAQHITPPYSWGNDEALYAALEEWTREWEANR